MRVAPSLPLALLVALAPPAHAAGPWSLHVGGGRRRAIADGRAATPDGVVPAILRVACQSGDGGSVCVALKVEDTPHVPSFDFAAFGRSDAPAARERLWSTRVGTGAAAKTIEARASGHFAKDPPGAFLFEVCGPNRGASEAAAIAYAIATGTGEIEISIAYPARDGHAIQARFPDDSIDETIAEALRGCPAAAAGEPIP